MLAQGQAEGQSTAELAAACAELERRLRAGQAASAEALLSAHPILAEDAEAALELIYTEFVAREALGQRPSQDGFLQRFPRWRDGLAQLFEIHGAIGRDTTLGLVGGGETRFAGDDREPATEGQEEPEPVRRVGNYELLGELGRGGMGVVYRARQLGPHRIVALKMILSGPDASPLELARFRTEAEAAARLAHPNIVQIYEVGEHEGHPFLSLEYAAGGSLEKRLGGRPWRAADAARLVEQLARAMQQAHEQGVVHRDLKPANVLLSLVTCHSSLADSKGPMTNDQGQFTPKITDFGLARRLASPSGEHAAARELTRTGTILGSPAYMAPEQAAGDGRQIGPATDVYALGAILYELLTGRRPFSGASALETLEQVRTREPLAPSKLQPGVPRDIETICLKCLHKEPGGRYETAAALADDLGRFLRGEGVRARPTSAGEKAWKWARRRPAVAGLLAALVGLAIVGATIATVLSQQTAAALATAGIKQDETEAALAARVIALAERDWQLGDLDAARRRLEECPPVHRGPQWRKLYHACHARQSVLLAPELTLPATAIVWSADGRHLAVNSNYEAGATVWDVDTGERVTLKHAFRVSGLARDPDGRLVSVGWPGADVAPTGKPITYEVKIWDFAHGHPLGGFTAELPLSRGPLSAGGRRVVGLLDGKLALLDLPGGPKLTPLEFRPSGLYNLSHDGRLVAWRESTTIRVWDTEANTEVGSFPAGKLATDVDFSPDGGRLAVTRIEREAGRNQRNTGCVEIWDYRAGKQLAVLRGHAATVGQVAFSADGGRLASASADQTVRVWDLDSGEEEFTFRGPGTATMGVAFSPDGLRLASGDNLGAVHIWDVQPVLEMPRSKGRALSRGR